MSRFTLFSWGRIFKERFALCKEIDISQLCYHLGSLENLVVILNLLDLGFLGRLVYLGFIVLLSGLLVVFSSCRHCLLVGMVRALSAEFLCLVFFVIYICQLLVKLGHM